MKRTFLCALALTASLFGALAVPVTFQVDLGPQINLGNFQPGSDTIEVRGSFNNWSGGFALTPQNGTSTVYSGTTDISAAAGSNVQFKFVQVSNGNVIWETTPNRSFILSNSAQALPVAYFNNYWEGGAIPVTFQINMSTQQAAGNFNPSAGDHVEVRGGFNNWGGGFVLTPSENNPNILVGTANVESAPGSRVEYKFVIFRAATGSIIWENDPNRAFTQSAGAQTLPVVYFNDLVGVPVKAIIEFQVDMSVQTAAGRFDPAIQEVYIRGNKLGWGNPPEGLQLLPDASRPGIYTNAVKSDTQLTGERIEYKATIWSPESWSTTWESGANKVVVFEGTEPKDANGYHRVSVGPFYFDGVAPGMLTTQDTIVTFRVNMNGAQTVDGTAFNPQSDILVLNGDFLPGGWQPWGGLFETYLFDNGESGGDAVANDGIYTTQITLPRGSSTRLVYKYGINGLDNEAAPNVNRIRYVRASGTYSLPVDKFGTMTQETQTGDLGTLSISKGTAGKLVLSWDGQPGVRLQKLSSVVGGTTSEVSGTQGQNRFEVSPDEPMAFFRLVQP